MGQITIRMVPKRRQFSQLSSVLYPTVLYTLWSIFSKSSHQAIHSRAEQSSHSTARVYPLGLTPSGPPERSAGNRASLRYREVGKHMRIMLPYREAAPPPSTTYFTSIYWWQVGRLPYHITLLLNPESAERGVKPSRVTCWRSGLPLPQLLFTTHHST